MYNFRGISEKNEFDKKYGNYMVNIKYLYYTA